MVINLNLLPTTNLLLLKLSFLPIFFFGPRSSLPSESWCMLRGEGLGATTCPFESRGCRLENSLRFAPESVFPT